MKPGKISGTARLIAAATVLLDAEGDGASIRPATGAAAWCARFLGRTPGGGFLLASVRSRFGRKLWRGLERGTHPGIIAHYWRRKHRIEALVRDALRDGFSRVVIYGAGFDTLGLRLADEFPEVEFCERDFPGVVAVKRAVCAEEPGRPNFCIESVDATEPLGHPGVRTLVVIEGVLMYLKPDALDAFWARVYRESGDGVRVVFTYMERWPDGSCGFLPRSRAVTAWLRFSGEPFCWSCAYASLPEFLDERGFTTRVNERLSAPPEHSGPAGENLVVAEVRRR